MAAGKGEITVDVTQAWVMTPVQPMDWLIVAPIVLCLGAGGILLMFRKDVRQHVRITLGGLALVVVANGALLHRVVTDGPLVMTMGRWLPPFGITFNADILGVSFALVASIVALLGALYAISDVDDIERRYGFYPFLMMMMAGVMGSFLTGDIFNLYVWFEVLLISSFGLIVLGSTHRQLDGALRYAFLNLIATTIFLITTGYLYGVFGTLNMADIARKAAEHREAGPLLTIAALYFFAFGMKAAAFPVNAWLPASYHTPKVVVSAIFAGLLTKVGVYALLRVGFTLFPPERDVFAPAFAIAGALTMVLGALGALAQNDIRRMLAFLVVSGIGLMLAGIAMSGPLGIGGAVFYALHSMVAMTAVFLLAGLMQRRNGAAHLSDAGGLYASSPLLAALALVLIFAVAGLPPFSGLWPKVMLVKAGLDIGAWWLVATILLSAFLTTLALARLFLLAFWRPAPAGFAGQASPDSRSALAGVVGLTVPLVVFGVYPEPVVQLSVSAAEWLLNPQPYVNAVFPAAQP
ncbi:MAG: Na+/H+ antiporter subunit D [Rhizobiaceae bacterium]|jgi:multicomponent Na+:H+ antiporter subunit D|nr:Na+/H+ antiporter subunit D [Rhizobiaceae bacterium]